ncbi:MAG TPA: TetR/AcrR family transcriptional regulator [Thermoleophilaceae bacterium]|nr:TetR/AcrR family transcriptional regulator [Thermoleophilaceae bacterium]
MTPASARGSAPPEPAGAAGDVAGPAPARRPGRPRSEQADRAILGAALRLLAVEGAGAFSMEAVAAEAGVGKTTVYRRWSSKGELIGAALELLRPPGPPEDAGSFEADLEAFGRGQGGRARDTGLADLLPRFGVAALGDPELRPLVIERVVGPVRAILAEIVRRGIDRGELTPGVDVEQAVDLLHGTTIYRILLSETDLGGADRTIAALGRTLREGLGNPG